MKLSGLNKLIRFNKRTKSLEALTAVLLLVMAVSVTGCSDHGDGTGLTDPPGEDNTISFASDIQAIFNSNCIGCHGAGGNAGLDLRSGLSFDNLVGVSANNSSGTLVMASNASASVLYQRMSASVGSAMPPSGVLPSATQAKVEQWIMEGALNN